MNQQARQNRHGLAPSPNRHRKLMSLSVSTSTKKLPAPRSAPINKSPSSDLDRKLTMFMSNSVSTPKLHEQSINNSNSQCQSANISQNNSKYTSEQSLPERLSQAFKGLTKPFKSNSSHNRSGTEVVSSNDMVYYASGAQSSSMSSKASNSTNGSVDKTGSGQRFYERRSVINSASKSKVSSKDSRRQSMDPNITSLDQLRQLYGSAPDFSDLGDDDQINQSIDKSISTPPINHNQSKSKSKSPQPSAASVKGQQSYSRKPPPPPYPGRSVTQRSSSSTQLNANSAVNGRSNRVKPQTGSKSPVYANVSDLAASHSDLVHSSAGLTVVSHSPTDSGYRSVSRSNLLSDSQLCSPKDSASDKVEVTLSTTIVSVNGHSNTIDSLATTSNQSVPSIDWSLGEETCTLQTNQHRAASSSHSPSPPELPTVPPPDINTSTLTNTGTSHSNNSHHRMTNCSTEWTQEHDTSTSVLTSDKLLALSSVPWAEKDIVAVLQRGRCKQYVQRIGVDVVPHLSHLLQRPLCRFVLLLRRLCRPMGYCSRQHVHSACRIILSPVVCKSSLHASIQAESLFSMESHSPSDVIRHSRTHRAQLQLSVGGMHGWLMQAGVCHVVNELAVVALTAVMQCCIEELILRALHKLGDSIMLTSDTLNQSIDTDPEFWGLLQANQHLITSRTADGALHVCATLLTPSLSTSASLSTLNSSSMGDLHNMANGDLQSKRTNGMKTNGSLIISENNSNVDLSSLSVNQQMDQCRLATCVGGRRELDSLITSLLEFDQQQKQEQIRNKKCKPSRQFQWSSGAVDTLYHYMKCTELTQDTQLQLTTQCKAEHLPCLSDWLRVSHSFAHHQHSYTVTSAHVQDTAALLLPSGQDSAPPSHLDTSTSEQALELCSVPNTADRQQLAKKQLAFNLLHSVNDLNQLNQLLPMFASALGPKRLNSADSNGLMPLMLMTVRGKLELTRVLLDAGAEVNACVGEQPSNHSLAHLNGANALTLAVLQHDIDMSELLIQAGADVDSATSHMENALQCAAVIGDISLCARLLSCGADAFRSTERSETEGYGVRLSGAVSALALAAAHGHTKLVHVMLSTQDNHDSATSELSLSDFLAEASSIHNNAVSHHFKHSRQLAGGNSKQPISAKHKKANSQLATSADGAYNRLSKIQQRAAQQALYYAAEHDHVDLAIELRNYGVPWTLYIWTQCFAAAFQYKRKSVLQLLLLDATQRDVHLLQDITHEFIDDALPMLVHSLQSTQHSHTAAQLAVLLQRLYNDSDSQSKAPPSLSDNQSTHSDSTSIQSASRAGPMIDHRFVNNAELSDVQFLVEDQLFYGHRIVLVNASDKFRQLLMAGSKMSIAEPAPIPIDNISYDIFQLLMEYLYSNAVRDVSNQSTHSISRLLAAANQMHISVLAEFCAGRLCSRLNEQNIVQMYKLALSESASVLQRECEVFMLKHLPSLVSNTEHQHFLKLLRSTKRREDLCAGLISCLTDRLNDMIAK